MLSLNKIYTSLFFMGLFLIPFNEFEGLSFLGEYKNEAATYFFLGAFAFLMVEVLLKKKFSFPFKSPFAYLIGAFVLWSFIATAINFETVFLNYFKQTSGISRYVKQTFSLLVSVGVFTILFWNSILKFSVLEIFKKIRFVFLCSLIFVFVYGCFEILIVVYGMGFLLPILKLFDFFPFVNTKIYPGSLRISSITYEVPALGNFLITVSAWMFSYIITEKKIYRFIPTFFIIVLMLYSDSRTAMIVITIQIVVLILILIHDIRFRANTISFLKFGAIGLGLILVVNSNTIYEKVIERVDRINFSKNLNKDVSNKTRFGMQYASIEVFKDHPITGVGLGQDTYHKRKYYPYWATQHNYEYKLWYKNQKIKAFPPAYNIYTRLLSELGIVGFVIFISLILLAIYYAILLWKFSKNEYKFCSVIILVSFIGLAINWMQTDFFRQYGFWLCLMLLIKLQSSKNILINE